MCTDRSGPSDVFLHEIRYSCEDYDRSVHVDPYWTRCEDKQTNMWRYACEPNETRVNFGEVHRLSTTLDENVEEFRVSPVSFTNFEFTIPEDVIQWTTELLHRYDSEEDDYPFGFKQNKVAGPTESKLFFVLLLR